MKVDRRRLVSKVIAQINDQSVADCGLNSWNGPLSIDTNDGSLEKPVGIRPHPLGGEIVDAGGGLSKRAEGEGTINKVVEK